MYEIFYAIAPVFLTILAGMVVERLEVLPRRFNQMLGLFVVNVCMPCLIFHILVNITAEQLARGWWWCVMLFAPAALGVGLWLFEKARGASVSEAIITSLGGCFCNAAFMGLPVVLNFLPGDEEATMICGLVILSTNTLIIPALVILDIEYKKLKGEAIPTGFLRHTWAVLQRYILSNPTLMGTLLGVIVAALGIHVWDPLDKTLESIGYLSPTCMLLSLGLSLRGKLARAMQGHTISVPRQLWLLACKLVLLPLITLGLLAATGYDGLWVGVAVLVIASGAAVVTSVLGELYRARPEESALNVVLSSIIGLFTLAGWIWVLRELGYFA